MATNTELESEAMCYAYGRADGANGSVERYQPQVDTHAFANRVVNTEACWGDFRSIYDDMLVAVKADETAKRDRMQRSMHA